MEFLTIDDFDFKGKTVFLRVDMNCPIDPETLEISGTKRIEETVETIDALNNAKIVIASHQGRVGNKEYTSMEKHAKVLEKLLDRKVYSLLPTLPWCDAITILALFNALIVSTVSSILFVPEISNVSGSMGQFMSTRKKTVLPLKSKSSIVRNSTYFSLLAPVKIF